jgi:hypothetical protein
MNLGKGKEEGVRVWNERELAAIERCEREGNCREYQSQVVLFGVDWANQAMVSATAIAHLLRSYCTCHCIDSTWDSPNGSRSRSRSRLTVAV